jgi:hypothetical protein
MAQSAMGHSGSPSGSVWWSQDRAVTISFIPPPGDRPVRHAPHWGSAHNYHFVPAPALQNAALEPSVPGGVSVVSEVRGIHVAGSFALERQVGTGTAYLQPAEFMPDYFRLTKPPMIWSGAFPFYSFCRKNKEPTSGLEPPTCSLRVIIQALQRFAHSCKCRINKELFVLRVAACCTVLRSQWCQSGVKITLVSTFA